MNQKLVNEIEILSNLVGVSGREGRISNYLKERLKKTTYEVTQDYIGNLVVRKKSKKDKPKVLLFAHMDEIGFIIRKITPEGFLMFERMGGVNTQILPGTRIVVDGAKGLVKGVIGVQAHHFMAPENKFKVPAISDMYMDIGAMNSNEVHKSGIDVGSVVALDSVFCQINSRLIRGKSLDNRMAVAILEQIALDFNREELPYDVCFCFPVMEEFNIRGLLPVYRSFKPDISIGLDITVACDTPDLTYNDICLGKGPAITCMNFHGGGTLAGVLPDEDLFDLTVKCANKKRINLQREVSPGIITENAFGLFENERGIRVLNLSIPTRYTHTPFETASISDVEDLYLLLKSMLLGELK